MTPRTGRPMKGETRREHRVAVKLDTKEMAILEECVETTQKTKTDIIVQGIYLVKQELDKKR